MKTQATLVASASQSGEQRIEIAEKEFIEPPLELISRIIHSFDGDLGENGSFQGNGTVEFLGGNTYTGSFDKSVMNGKGRYQWISKNVSYEGDFHLNQITGKGTYRWQDGSTYEGEVRNGLRHGFGIFTWSSSSTWSGLRYEGNWINGKRDGEGILYFNWPNQQAINSYKGSWKENLKDGFGLMLYPSGNIYRGEWKNDEKNGKGRMTWKLTKGTEVHEIYEGDWRNGKPHGYGSYYWLRKTDKDEKVTSYSRRNFYQGEWKQGKRHGRGVFYYADGSKFIGMWENNLKHGDGTFYFSDGRILSGNYDRDRLSTYEREGNAPKYIATFQTVKVDDEGAVDRILRQHLGKLKDIYKYYCSIGFSGEDESLNLSLLQFSQMIKDCEVPTAKLPLHSIEICLIETVSDTNTINLDINFIFREFLEALTKLSKLRYPDQETYSNSLAMLISQNINTCTYRNRTNLKRKARETFLSKLNSLRNEYDVGNKEEVEGGGTIEELIFRGLPLSPAHSTDIWNFLKNYQSQTLTLYNKMQSNAQESVTVRDLLLLLKNRGVFDVVLSISRASLFLDQEGIQVEQKLSYYEFLNVLLNCGMVKHFADSTISQEQKLQLFFSQLLDQRVE